MELSLTTGELKVKRVLRERKVRIGMQFSYKRHNLPSVWKFITRVIKGLIFGYSSMLVFAFTMKRNLDKTYVKNNPSDETCEINL